LTLLGNPTRKRGIYGKFLDYAPGYDFFKQDYSMLTALVSKFVTSWIFITN
jgi:hypothetical protein